MASKINKEIFEKEILKGTSMWEAAQLAGSEATTKHNLSRVACRLKEDLGIESVTEYQREKVRNAMKELSALI